MNIDPEDKNKGGYLKLHTLETDLRIGDDDWHDNFSEFRDRMEEKGHRYFDYDQGFLGGQPYWLQYFDNDGEEEGFVGQINCFRWGNFHDITIYLSLYYEEGEKYVMMNFQMS